MPRLPDWMDTPGELGHLQRIRGWLLDWIAEHVLGVLFRALPHD